MDMMKKIWSYLFKIIAWIIILFYAFYVIGYFYNILEAVLRNGWDGFVLAHGHAAHKLGYRPTLIDILRYPLIMNIIFLLACFFFFIGTHLSKINSDTNI